MRITSVLISNLIRGLDRGRTMADDNDNRECDSITGCNPNHYCDRNRVEDEMIRNIDIRGKGDYDDTKQG